MNGLLQLNIRHSLANAISAVALLTMVGMALRMVTVRCAFLQRATSRTGRSPLLWCLISLVFTASFATGCATSGSNSRSPRPGDGLREYQRLVLDLRKVVTASRKSVETLAAASQRNSSAAYARFDDALRRLEVSSINARAHADAMEKRGEAYFEEWGEEISASGNEASRGQAKARFAELRLHLDAVLKDSRQVRQEFRQFLDGLRELRTKLGESPTPVATEQVRPALVQAASDGRQAEEAMNQLLSTLKTAETAVMSGPAPAPKAGGKS